MASPSIVLLHMSQEFDDWIMPSPPHRRRTSRFLACDSDAGPTPPAIRRRFHTGKLHSALSPQITHAVQEKLHVCSATPRDAASSFVHRATAARFTFPQPYHLHHLQLQSIGQQYRQYRIDIILHRPFVQERTSCIHNCRPDRATTVVPGIHRFHRTCPPAYRRPQAPNAIFHSA